MTSFVEPGEAIETADEVLSRPEYQEDQPSLLGRVLERIFEWLEGLFSPVAGSFGSVVIGYLILAVAVAVAAFFIWKFWRRFERKPSADVEVSVEIEVSERLTRAEWLARAEEAEATGDWDKAVHARYHALTAGLADNEVLASEASTTSGEHRSRFTDADGDPQRVGRFSTATDRYEQVWFGGSDARQPDRDVLHEVDRELLS